MASSTNILYLDSFTDKSSSPGKSFDYGHYHHRLTLDFPRPLMSTDEHNELMGGTKVHLMGTRVSP